MAQKPYDIAFNLVKGDKEGEYKIDPKDISDLNKLFDQLYKNLVDTAIDDGSITTAKLADSAVTSVKIADDTIVNADISTAADILQSKIDNDARAIDADKVDGIHASASAAANILLVKCQM